jgi:2-phospho-L-lactate guanylyltransferase (CobY/MobA/RfbA family)
LAIASQIKKSSEAQKHEHVCIGPGNWTAGTILELIKDATMDPLADDSSIEQHKDSENEDEAGETEKY